MRWFVYLSVLVFIGGCSSSSISYLDKAKQFCVEQNGTIITSGDEILCQYQETVEYDEGSSVVSQQCEVKNFYEGTCNENEPTDSEPEDDNTSKDVTVPENAPKSTGVNEIIDSRVKNILNNLDNTGYSHNRHNNFSLHPAPSDFNSSTQTYNTYNLFLDCSGYVGYYVLQSIDKRLYEGIEKGHSCTSRPLAADFADTFHDKPTIFTEATLDDIEQNNTCWGQVLNLADAKAGDIIVYAHSEDLTEEYTCKSGRKIIMGTCTNPGKNYKDQNLTCKARKNTGHILFITRKPYKSTKCRDRDDDAKYCGDSTGELQWIVPVSDSTTYPHSKDSRGGGDFKGIKSTYKDNNYTAWNRGNYRNNRDYDLERCEDDESNMTFHRHCKDDYSMNKLEEIIINTGESNNKKPTGIGAGKIYVNNAMDGFRKRYGAKIERADVYVGRIIKCK